MWGLVELNSWQWKNHKLLGEVTSGQYLGAGQLLDGQKVLGLRVFPPPVWFTSGPPASPTVQNHTFLVNY